MNSITKSDTYKCAYCVNKYCSNRFLRRHVRKFHPDCEQPPRLKSGRQAKLEKEHKCNICLEKFDSGRKLIAHKKVHRFKTGLTIKLKFQSKSEFIAWKNAEENRLICRYHIYHSHTSTKKIIKYYQCHRNGFYQQRGKGKRTLKSQGSCKSGRCLASISAHHYPNGTVSIIYYNQHSNHDHDPAHITLHKEEKERLAELIRGGTSFDEIISKTQYRLGTEDNFQIKFLTKHELHNIVRSYNIPRSNLHDCDAVKSNENNAQDNFAVFNNSGANDYLPSGDRVNSVQALGNVKIVRKRGRKANISECRKYLDEIGENIENMDVRSVALLKNLLKQCQGILNASLQKPRNSIPKSNIAAVDGGTRRLVKSMDGMLDAGKTQFLSAYNNSQLTDTSDYVAPRRQYNFIARDRRPNDAYRPRDGCVVELSSPDKGDAVEKGYSEKSAPPRKVPPISIFPKPGVAAAAALNRAIDFAYPNCVRVVRPTSKTVTVTLKKPAAVEPASEQLLLDGERPSSSGAGRAVTTAAALINNRICLNSFAKPDGMLSVEMSSNNSGIRDYIDVRYGGLQRFDCANNAVIYPNYNNFL